MVLSLCYCYWYFNCKSATAVSNFVHLRSFEVKSFSPIHCKNSRILIYREEEEEAKLNAEKELINRRLQKEEKHRLKVSDVTAFFVLLNAENICKSLNRFVSCIFFCKLHFVEGCMALHKFNYLENGNYKTGHVEKGQLTLEKALIFVSKYAFGVA